MPSFRDDLYGRINALGIFVLLILVVLGARLWFLQVLAGDSYSALANENRLRNLTVDAPRGLILDGRGEVLVGNRPALAVTLPPRSAENTALVVRLANTLGVPLGQIRARLNDKRPNPLKPRRVAEDVDLRRITQIMEHPGLFPGVEVQTLAIRRYPFKSLAAHVLGYIGELSDMDASNPSFKQYQYGDIVGKTGIERQYESVLQGVKGSVLMEVNASGRPLRVVSQSAATPGRTLQLTIDHKVQAVTEKQLAGAILAARRGRYPHAAAGAAVVMDVRTGDVVALASYPTYDPSTFLGGIPTKVWQRLNSKKGQYPLFDRAITGLYPPGSTFKPVTAAAGLNTGVINVNTTFDCQGKWTDMGKQWPKWCWNRSGHGRLAFIDAVADSCDVYFYNIGLAFYRRDGVELREELQQYARSFGYGARTGIDLAAEARGRIPNRKWKADFNKRTPQYAPWLPGDTVNLAIGQGDMLASPIQIVRAYAAIANGGTVYQPHLVKRILTPAGLVSHVTTPVVQGRLPVTPSQLKAIQDGLVAVTQYGTGKAAFAGFPYKVAGKTGTSQVAKKDDYALFAGYAPADNPRWAAMMIIEQGGHGGSVAAPAVRNIFATLLGAPEANVNPSDQSR